MKEVKRPGRRFPVLKMTGGPTAHDLRIEMDGEELLTAHRLELTADVNDVVRVKVYQMIEADLELEAADVEDAGWICNVSGMVVERIADGKIKRRVPLVIGKGKTQSLAMLDAIAALEEPDVPVQ